MNQLKRLRSGIAGLDTLLKGGFISGASYIIQGRPGSGKTILANQVGFSHVRDGGRVLFATLLAEPHERLFQFLSTLSFFDESRIGEEIQFVSAFDTLENDGLDEVVRLLRREITRQKSTVMIVDGLLNARSRAESPIDTKKFISELQGHAAFAGCTVLFLTSSQLDEGSPEHTMVDGIIEMGEEPAGVRSVRWIKLRKTRGSGAISGAHECEITRDGLVVYPRLESVFARPSREETETVSLTGSGVPTLDTAIGGGLVASSVTLVLGPSGVGKTSFGIQFLGACTPEEPALHFGFFETPPRLRMKAAALGKDFKALEASGALSIVHKPKSEGALDQLGFELLHLVEERKIKRVFIDSLGGMARVAAAPSRLMAFFSTLMEQLRAMGVTVMAAWETSTLLGRDSDVEVPQLSGVADNLLLIRFEDSVSELKRVLSILKVRDNEYDPSLMELFIRSDGMQVARLGQHKTVSSGDAAVQPLPGP